MTPQDAQRFLALAKTQPADQWKAGTAIYSHVDGTCLQCCILTWIQHCLPPGSMIGPTFSLTSSVQGQIMRLNDQSRSHDEALQKITWYLEALIGTDV